MSSMIESSGCSVLNKTDECHPYNKLWELEKDEELRIEVSKQDSVDVILTLGDVEVIGVELAPNVCYTFGPNRYVCLHSWTGAIIKISVKSNYVDESLGSDDTLIYKSEESLSLAYLNLHYFLKKLRDDCHDGSLGPRVMICGPTDSGKTTLCKILLNYAIRNGNNGIYVDLDVGQNSLTIPGSLSASYINKPVHSLSEGKVTTSQSFGISEDYSEANCPLVYFVGDTSVVNCSEACSFFINLIGKTVKAKLEESKKIAKSGCIINTSGYVTGKGMKILKDTVKSFDVNVIIVLHDERLYNQLKKENENIVNIFILPKSTSVKIRSKKERRITRDKMVASYFSGIHGSFAPTYIKESFDDISIYIPVPVHFSHACLPIGVMTDSKSSLKMRKIAITPSMLNCVLAVLMCEVEEDAVSAPVAGFVNVVKINMEKKKIRFMSPCIGPLPFKHFCWSKSIKYTKGIDFM